MSRGRVGSIEILMSKIDQNSNHQPMPNNINKSAKDSFQTKTLANSMMLTYKQSEMNSYLQAFCKRNKIFCTSVVIQVFLTASSNLLTHGRPIGRNSHFCAKTWRAWFWEADAGARIAMGWWLGYLHWMVDVFFGKFSCIGKHILMYYMDES